MNNKNTINFLISLKDSSIRFFLTGILLAVAISLFANSLLMSLPDKSSYVLWGSIFAILAVLVFLLLQPIFKKRKTQTKIKGVVLLENGSKNIISVHRYVFSEKMSRYFKHIFAEDKNIEKLWNNTKGIKFEEGNNIYKLIKEAAEYYVLDKLSLMLTDFYNNKDSAFKITKYNRRDIPHILTTNRFLNLFSTPMEDRACFCGREDSSKSQGVTVTAYSSEGAMYDRFELALPVKSKISKEESGRINIKTPVLTLSFAIDFPGFNAISPRGFEKYYLKRDIFSFRLFKIGIDITVSPKFCFFKSKDTLENYLWADEFIEKIERDVSLESFLEKINWEANLLLLERLDSLNNKMSPAVAPAGENSTGG